LYGEIGVSLLFIILLDVNVEVVNTSVAHAGMSRIEQPLELFDVSGAII
jgi:hypothetical protein